MAQNNQHLLEEWGIPEEDRKHIDFAKNGAVVCSDIECLLCKRFNGGYSGHCSSCWNKISADEQREASKTQAKLQVERSKKRDEELQKAHEEENERKAAKKRKLDNEKAEWIKEKEKGGCYRIAGRTVPEDCEAEDFEYDAPVEIWTCGMLSSRFQSKHDHNQQRLAHLQDIKDKLTGTLKGVIVSTEADCPWWGFFIPVSDNPEIFEGLDTEQIFEKILPDNDNMEYSSQNDNSDCFFSSLNHVKSNRKYKQATTFIKKHGKSGSFFVIDIKTDDSAGHPVFVGGVTENGDIFGVRSHKVWT